MTMLQTLQAALEPLAAGGAWPLVAAQGTTTPYIVWQQVVSVIENTLQGATNVQNTRIQIDAYASTYAAVQTLADAIVAAMAAAVFTNVQLSTQDLYEQDVKLYRVTLDYSVWSSA